MVDWHTIMGRGLRAVKPHFIGSRCSILRVLDVLDHDGQLAMGQCLCSK
jgi:hypothetical protein